MIKVQHFANATLNEYEPHLQKQIWEQMDRVHRKHSPEKQHAFENDVRKYGAIGMVAMFISIDIKDGREINWQYLEMMFNGCLYFERLQQQAKNN